MQTHYSSDAGTVPLIKPPKTMTTLCGLRAPYDRIDNKNPTCPDCLAEKQRNKTAGSELAKLIDDISDKV